MKHLISTFLLITIAASAFCQQGKINGIIRDTINKTHLTNTVIAVLQEKDSVLYKFTRSDGKGAFQISNLQKGTYVLMATHPTYADYVDKFTISSDTSSVNLGQIKLTLKANLLEEVIVQQTIAAMRIKGDTIEYKADSFKVAEGAPVEEMLKKMPGIQVDKDGKITAYGETVQKILVDGDEFFGDDPTIVSKNLQAKAVDKVQVFDKKSDQATFTGIDDGEKSKTINLKLKDNMKKGYFGKVDLASNGSDRWNNSAMINSFKNKRKLSAYGIMSSTGTTGLSWEDNDKYGGSSNMQYDEMGDYYYYSWSDDFYYSGGLPKAWSGGLNYSNKFKDDKFNLNGSYRYNKLDIENTSSYNSTSLLPDTIFNNSSTNNSVSSKQRHSVNGTFEWMFDSTTSMKVIAKGYVGDNDSYSSSYSQSTSGNNKVNENKQNNNNFGNNGQFNSNWLLRKKFKKVGRTFSLNLDQQYNSSDNTGFLFSEVSLYDAAGLITSLDTTDQKKTGRSSTFLINARSIYTEPLLKKVFLELSYAYRVSKSEQEKFSYNKAKDGIYSVMDSIYSNSYDFTTYTHTGGISFKYNGKKLTGSIGLNLANSDFKQENVLKDTVLNRNYTNFFPKASLYYKFSNTQGINISYNGSTQQPRIYQLQPVADNSNPMYITIGNPLLDQEFRHNINLNYNQSQVMKQRGMYIYGGFTLTQNAIVNSTYTDNSNRTVSQYINSDDNYNGYMGGGYYFKWKKPNLDVSLRGGLNLNKTNNIVNLLKNTTKSQSYNLGFNISKDKEKKYNLYFSTRYQYNTSTSSIKSSYNTDYWSQNYSLSGTVYLPWKIEVNSGLDVTLNQKTDQFSKNNNIFLWNAYLGRKFLKNDQATFKISGYDILKQNKGYYRSINSTVISESNNQVIGRYFTVGVLWNFTKSPATSTNNQTQP